MSPSRIGDEGQESIRAARARLPLAEQASEKAFAAWYVAKNAETVEAFRAALEEQSSAARALAEVVKREHGLADEEPGKES